MFIESAIKELVDYAIKGILGAIEPKFSEIDNKIEKILGILNQNHNSDVTNVGIDQYIGTSSTQCVTLAPFEEIFKESIKGIHNNSLTVYKNVINVLHGATIDKGFNVGVVCGRLGLSAAPGSKDYNTVRSILKSLVKRNIAHPIKVNNKNVTGYKLTDDTHEKFDKCSDFNIVS